MITSSRREAMRFIKKLEFNSTTALIKLVTSLIIALLIAFVPNYEGLTEAANWMLFILLFAAGLWVSEAIPAFAVAILVIALEIVILGPPFNLMNLEPKGWTIFVNTWSSPLIWLFFGGFIIAQAAHKTHLDNWVARKILKRCGTNPGTILLGLMSITFVFSMFVSNTATTIMMMAIIMPIADNLKIDNPFKKAVLLGIPFAANVGGMGTIIGTPPNAIAVGALEGFNITFLQWMKFGLPPAIVMMFVIWALLRFLHPSNEYKIDLQSVLSKESAEEHTLPKWKRMLVMITFFITLILWMTSSFHGIPTPVVSFLPITLFTVGGVLKSKDIKMLSWDVLLLLAGGLSLGVGVSKTGLALWIVDLLPLDTFGIVGMSFGFAVLTWILSNFMSHTAAANIIVPIGLATGGGLAPQVVIPLALASSGAMCLPISTPPNAIAFATGDISTRDFVKPGIIIGILTTLISVGWIQLIS